MRSDAVTGANEILFGLAVMPSLLFSSPDGLSSIELADVRFWCAAAKGVEAVLVGFLTAVVAGRAGGLLRELPRAGLTVDEAGVVRGPVESLGATLLVKGRVGGVIVLCFGVDVSSPRKEPCLSMTVKRMPQVS